MLIKYLLLCIIFVVVTTKKAYKSNKKATDCEEVRVHDTLHKKHVLANGINRPYQLVIYDQQVFFSYNTGQNNQDTFAIAYVTLNNSVPTIVKEITNGFALAIDHLDKIIYFGGSDGIYSANLTDLRGTELIVENRNIWDLFYHNNYLYFIEFPSQLLYKYDIKEKKMTPYENITEKIYQFVIDGENDIFITTKDGLYEIKNGTNTSIPYTGPKLFRAIEVNNKGVAHFCAYSKIYVPNKKNHTLTEIANIKNIFGLTFDADDNIIYSNPLEIVKLLPYGCT